MKCLKMNLILIKNLEILFLNKKMLKFWWNFIIKINNNLIIKNIYTYYNEYLKIIINRFFLIIIIFKKF